MYVCQKLLYFLGFFGFCIYSTTALVPNNSRSCDVRDEFQNIFSRKINCSNLKYFTETHGYQCHLQLLNKTHLIQWWISNNHAQSRIFTIDNQLIEEIVEHRYYNSSAEVIFKSTADYFLGFWNLITVFSPRALPLSRANVASFRFVDTLVYIIEAIEDNKVLTKKLNLTSQSMINSSITKFPSDITKLSFNPNNTDTIIVTLENGNDKIIDFVNPQFITEDVTSKGDWSPRDIIILCLIFAAVAIGITAICCHYGTKILKYKIYQSRHQNLPKPVEKVHISSQKTTELVGNTSIPTYVQHNPFNSISPATATDPLMASMELENQLDEGI